MNEIIQKNEESNFLENIENIKEELQKCIKNMELNKKDEINNIEDSFHASTQSK